jgi:hypothetical protein
MTDALANSLMACIVTEAAEKQRVRRESALLFLAVCLRRRRRPMVDGCIDKNVAALIVRIIMNAEVDNEIDERVAAAVARRLQHETAFFCPGR